MKVQELMSTDLATFGRHDSVSEASRRMTSRKSAYGLVTTSQGNLEGVITDQDILSKCLSHWHDPRLCEVGNHMATNFATVPFGAEAEEARKVMQSLKIDSLPIVMGAKVVGMISLSDLDGTSTKPRSEIPKRLISNSKRQLSRKVRRMAKSAA